MGKRPVQKAREGRDGSGVGDVTVIAVGGERSLSVWSLPVGGKGAYSICHCGGFTKKKKEKKKKEKQMTAAQERNV